MDVSLRLKLVNQLSRPAEEAERDLKDIKRAAEQLGRTKAGGGLAQDLQGVGRAADAAKAKIGGVGREAAETRRAMDRIGGGLAGMKGSAAQAEAAIHGIKSAANQTRTAVARIGDGAFASVKSGAASAENAIRQIGRAADEADQKLRRMRAGGATGPATARPGLPRTNSGGMMSALEGATDQFGVPLAVGAGAAYMAGALPASAGVVAGAAVRGAARDEFTSDQLMVLGQYGDQDQARYDKQMREAGAKFGIGSQGSMGVFGLLMGGGLSADDASAMTSGALTFSKATQAAPEDAANATVALRNLFGIGPDKMMAAYDAIALGGKEGQFEVKDMAKSLPPIAALMSGAGESGLSGTRLAVALAQAIRTTTGTSEGAATYLENMLGKFKSPDFIDNAKEVGINPERTFKQANKKGESPILALLDEIKAKVGTNEFDLKKLMPDVQGGGGLVAALKSLDEIRAMMARMEGANGTVMKDFALATDNASSAFDRFTANVAEKAKMLGATVLPALTEAMNAISTTMEGDGGPDPLAVPEGASPEAKAGAAAAGQRGARLNRFFETMFGMEPSEASRRLEDVDAAGEHGLRRKRFERLTGTGVDGSPGEGVEQAFKADLAPAAEASMQGYNAALAAEGEQAKAQARSIADAIKSMLGFTVSPTIAPTFIPPAGVPGKQAGASPSNYSINQTITSPNPQHAAAMVRRDQAREIRAAQARSLADTGRSFA